MPPTQVPWRTWRLPSNPVSHLPLRPHHRPPSPGKTSAVLLGLEAPVWRTGILLALVGEQKASVVTLTTSWCQIFSRSTTAHVTGVCWTALKQRSYSRANQREHFCSETLPRMSSSSPSAFDATAAPCTHALSRTTSDSALMCATRVCTRIPVWQDCWDTTVTQPPVCSLSHSSPGHYRGPSLSPFSTCAGLWSVAAQPTRA